jgi:hypothetical protein
MAEKALEVVVLSVIYFGDVYHVCVALSSILAQHRVNGFCSVK